MATTIEDLLTAALRKGWNDARDGEPKPPGFDWDAYCCDDLGLSPPESLAFQAGYQAQKTRRHYKMPTGY